MKTFLIAASLLLASFAHADGFECEASDYALNINIYNQTSASAGTRSAAVMILADQRVQFGNKTIARFDSSAGTVSSSQVVYTAIVDLRYSDLSRKGELVLGTKLGELKSITASIFFNYNLPVRKGAEVAGQLRWVKRNGTYGATDLVCKRYLKN